MKGKVVRFPDIIRCMTCYVHVTNRGVAAAFKPVSSGLYYNPLDIIIRTFSASDIFKYSLFFFLEKEQESKFLNLFYLATRINIVKTVPVAFLVFYRHSGPSCSKDAIQLINR